MRPERLNEGTSKKDPTLKRPHRVLKKWKEEVSEMKHFLSNPPKYEGVEKELSIDKKDKLLVVDYVERLEKLVFG